MKTTTYLIQIGLLGTMLLSAGSAGGVETVAQVSAGGNFSLFLKNDGTMWGMGIQSAGRLCDGAYSNTGTNQPEQIVAPPVLPPGYNQITVQFSGGTNWQLSFLGGEGTKHELDRSFSLSPVNWIPQVTNPAGTGGTLVFTNAPDRTTNNFWRIRSVP